MFSFHSVVVAIFSALLSSQLAPDSQWHTPPHSVDDITADWERPPPPSGTTTTKSSPFSVLGTSSKLSWDSHSALLTVHTQRLSGSVAYGEPSKDETLFLGIPPKLAVVGMPAVSLFMSHISNGAFRFHHHSQALIAADRICWNTQLLWSVSKEVTFWTLTPIYHPDNDNW